METVQQDALIARIRKLMAMANHPGSNENEAAVAAEKIQALLVEHNISMAQVGDGEAATAAGAEKREKTKHAKAAMYKYQQDLMRALARNNFCMYFLEEMWKDDPRGQEHYDSTTNTWKKMRRVKAHTLLGRQVNIEVTKITYDYLVERMDALLPYEGMQKRGKEALLWLAGCTERLTERLDERRVEAEAESVRKAQEEATRARHPAAAPSDGKGLVVLTDVYGSEDDLNRDAAYGWEPGTTARRRREREAADAAHNAEMKAKQDALVAGGMDKTRAWYVARGYDMSAIEAPKPETDAQRRKREEREYRRDRKWRQQEWRQQYREDSKKSHPAYRAGKQAGRNIGLDQQVGETSSKRRIK